MKIENIGEAGTIKLGFPILKIGSGKPKVSIILALHGNEATGILIIGKLLENINLKKGTIQVITVCQLGQAVGMRHMPLDLQDLNRILPGRKTGNMSERMASRLMDILKESDLVIDLHTFDMQTLLTGILIDDKSRTSEKSEKMLEFLNPDIVWNIKLKTKEERKFSGALAPALNEIKVPNFALEMNQIEMINDDEIERVVDGLENILKKMEMIDGKVEDGSKLVKISRKQITSDISGLIVPKIGVGQEISKNQVICEIINLHSLKKTIIRSREKGIVMQILNKSLINTGQEFCALGV